MKRVINNKPIVYSSLFRSTSVGTGVVRMSGGDACVVLAHHIPFSLSTRLLVEPVYLVLLIQRIYRLEKDLLE